MQVENRLAEFPRGAGVVTLADSKRCIACEQPPAKYHLAREMMFGTGAEFRYAECSSCGTLWLDTPPAHYAGHYPSSYYSFCTQPRSASPFSRAKALICLLPGMYRLSQSRKRLIFRSGVNLNSRILDVGSGSGELVNQLRARGFRNVLGIDPYCGSPSPVVQRKNLSEISGEWDLIMFHHSFEHISDPKAALMTARRLLAPAGRCLIRIPIVAWAWRRYGAAWVQLDAPRHVFVYSEAGFRLLAQRCGFKIAITEYDSDEFQFIGSECYQRNVPLGEVEKLKFNKEAVRRFRRQAKNLNREGMGDQAGFILDLQQGSSV